MNVPSAAGRTLPIPRIADVRGLSSEPDCRVTKRRVSVLVSEALAPLDADAALQRHAVVQRRVEVVDIGAGDLQETVAPVIFGPEGSEPLLGVLALEGLGISVDPKTRSLKREYARSLKSRRQR